ncbi:uncharacterized protein LOC144383672 isoform X2 [Gasterosteus aculeatus]
MSVCRQRAGDLVAAYSRSLEQQIVGRGSNLACRDEEVWTQAEGLLRDADAQEAHCLGLDPLRVMAESLAAAAAAAGGAAGAGRVRTGGGLQGLEKAFEVLEQAALNLYLGPWRDEYKVVKMYSGMFTHFIKPVLSMPQVEKLFGLLGYQASSSRSEQLRLQAPAGGAAAASPSDLLCLSCAFFLARRECRLLRAALGKREGDAQWELSVVRERQRGHGPQAAMDNAKKSLASDQLMQPYDGEAEVDLYTDQHVKGGQREAALHAADESPHSLTPAAQSGASAPKAHSNGVRSPSSASPRETCVSKLDCRLSRAEPPEPSREPPAVAAGARQARRPPRGESRSDKADSQARSLQVGATGLCRSEADADRLYEQAPPPCLGGCVDRGATHRGTAGASFQPRYAEEPDTAFPDGPTEKASEFQPLSLQGGGLGLSPSPPPEGVAMSSLALCSDPEAMMTPRHPFAYHECCDRGQPDPLALCFSCGVFHAGSCRDVDFCQTHHNIKPLGVCGCGTACARKPLVLCRYCGEEYCSNCWYRSPVVCSCGQTFDQSSPV